MLELENELQKERQKLGELRKKHYELAGVAEGWEEGEPGRGLAQPPGREVGGCCVMRACPSHTAEPGTSPSSLLFTAHLFSPVVNNL